MSTVVLWIAVLDVLWLARQTKAHRLLWMLIGYWLGRRR